MDWDTIWRLTNIYTGTWTEAQRDQLDFGTEERVAYCSFFGQQMGGRISRRMERHFICNIVHHLCHFCLRCASISFPWTYTNIAQNYAKVFIFIQLYQTALSLLRWRMCSTFILNIEQHSSDFSPPICQDSAPHPKRKTHVLQLAYRRNACLPALPACRLRIDPDL